jgi:DNA-binding transcriptional LysR family regulator
MVSLRNLDLNLLHALRALLEERNVTRAAKRCFVSQPAMSKALGRLRETLGDPLLIRTGSAYERTVRGERILQELDGIMRRLEGAIQGEEFDPARSQERFRVVMTDHGSMVLLPPLMKRVRIAAPKVQIQEFAWNDRAYEQVDAGRIDVALSAETSPPNLQTEVLYKEDFVCLAGRAQRLRPRRFTLKQYLELPHALVETWAGQQAPVDRPLAELGRKRNVVLLGPYFLPTIFIVAYSDLVLTVPRRLGRIATAIATVHIVEAPREIKGFTHFMTWHPRLTTEPSHAWFREQLRTVAQSIRTE